MFRRLYDWCIAPAHLFFILLSVLALPNVALCFTEHFSFMVGLCNVVLPVAVYWLLLTFFRRSGRAVLWMLPLMFFAAFQLVLLYLFGRSVIAVDMFLNLVTTNAGEAMELLDNLLPAVVGVVVVYVPVIALGVAAAVRKDCFDRAFVLRQRRLALYGVGAGLLCLVTCYVTDRDYRIGNHLYPVNVGYNLVLAVERNHATVNYYKTSAGFSFKAHSVHSRDTAEVYVLVIGETARAMEFGLYGYGRNTTPLMSHEKGLTVFSSALTQSNTTHKSVPMLLSAASATDFNRIYREKGIIAAFREAGFHTVFLSNQRPNHSFIDFFGKEADEWKFIKDGLPDDSIVPDTRLLPLVEHELCRRRRKELIVLHTYGSHFNYRDRYTPDEARFKPDDKSKATYKNRSQLVNAYDNTIVATDLFLYRLIRMLRDRGVVSAMLYTSDHGENIFDDSRRRFLHASPVPTYYELHVPLMVWLSDSYRSAYPSVVSALSANCHKTVQTSESVFHTMLSLAGIATPYRVERLSVASPSYVCSPVRYLDDHNRPVDYSQLGLDYEDFVMLRRKMIIGD